MKRVKHDFFLVINKVNFNTNTRPKSHRDIHIDT